MMTYTDLIAAVDRGEYKLVSSVVRSNRRNLTEPTVEPLAGNYTYPQGGYTVRVPDGQKLMSYSYIKTHLFDPENTLHDLTHHESGIIVWRESNTIVVCNWYDCGDGQLPLISPIGDPVPWDHDIDFDTATREKSDDLRAYIPDDAEIIYDANADMPAFMQDDTDHDGYAYTIRRETGEILCTVLVPNDWD